MEGEFDTLAWARRPDYPFRHFLSKFLKRTTVLETSPPCDWSAERANGHVLEISKSLFAGKSAPGASDDNRDVNSAMEAKHINELTDGILVKIFQMTIGFPTAEFDPFFGGFFEDEDGVEPTVVCGFEHTFILPQVCKRWRNLVETSPCLWNKVFVGRPDDAGSSGSPVLYHPVISFPWWSRHASQVEVVHVRGNQTRNDGPLDTFNLGVVSMLSPQKLRVLHLDDCFENGATESLLPFLSTLTNLEQLQVGPAGDEFLCKCTCLTSLKKLKVLELQAMDNSCIQLSPKCLPLSLEVLGLGAMDVVRDADDTEYLTNLRVLKLVEVDWNGQFCGHIEKLSRLTELVISDVLHTTEEFVEPNFLPEDLLKLSALQNIRHLEIQGDLETEEQGFFERMGEEVLKTPPFTSLECLCLNFGSSSKMATSFGQYKRLTRLHLEGFSFPRMPDAILELPLLVDLGVVNCGLNTFPDTAPKCADSIVSLRLCDNKLEEVPEDLVLWANLNSVDLSGNPIVFNSGMPFFVKMRNLESIRMILGTTEVSDEVLDGLEEKCGTAKSAFRLGYLCGQLREKVPQCRVYL